MIAFIGDIHGDAQVLRAILSGLPESVSTVIQVGDLGYFPNTKQALHEVACGRDLIFVEGNHDDHDGLRQDGTIRELSPSFYHAARGSTTMIEGKRIAFLGGAASVDKALRLSVGWHWSEKENITETDVERFDRLVSVDIFVTHVPPQSAMEKHFDPAELRLFGLPTTWIDPNAVIVDAIWQRLGAPPLFCGHMHRSVTDGNLRILDINEVALL